MVSIKKILTVVFFGILMARLLFAQDAKELLWAGRIIQTEGCVQIQRGGSDRWLKTAAQELLFSGDFLRTGPSGWAALVMADESVIQVNKNSLILFKKIGPRAGWIDRVKKQGDGDSASFSEYILKKGRMWLRNKNVDQMIDIHAPYVSTSIRGTELDIDSRDASMTVVTVLEGRVLATNTAQKTRLEAFEQVAALPGRLLEKNILLNPENTVQWTISFRPAVDLLSEFVVPPAHYQEAWQELFGGNPRKAEQQFLNQDTRDAMIGRSAAHLFLREYQKAAAVLEKLQAQGPDDLPSAVLQTFLGLIRSDTAGARQGADKVLKLAPAHPAGHVLDAWVKQAAFDLSGALAATRKALSLDPNHVQALINLARLEFASGHLQGVQKTIDKVIRLSPGHAEVLNIKGFLMLAMLRDAEAAGAFEAAVRADPALGEPHLGLCLYHMRMGNEARAQEQITTAVALEPQRSVFVSYWAKMLYEKKRFKQALDMLEQACRLDPADPTPWLYKSYVLKDLNRIHEAIFSLQKAMSLNNNQAVYKSRFFLDRDLAVQNVNLAQLYKKLGVSEWASVKAIKSMKQDYLNFAAHAFVASQLEYLHGPSSLGARSSRQKAFLMKPANANTLNSFNNYTLFFDQPETEATVTGWAGSSGYSGGKLDLNSALPQLNAAFQITAEKIRDEGWQTYDWQDLDDYKISVKWDATYRDLFSLQMEQKSLVTGDLSSIYEYCEQPDPYNHKDTDLKQIRAGYMHKQSPENNLILFLQRDTKHHKSARTHLDGNGTALVGGFNFDYIYDYNKYEILEDPFTSIQAQQTLKMGDHTPSAGLFWYESDRDYTVNEITDTDYYWAGTQIFAFNLLTSPSVHFIRPRKMQSLYLQDIWNPSGRFTIEAAVYLDRIFNVNSAEELTWDNTYLNPRAGVIFRPTDRDTIAVSYKRFLESYESVDRIDPVEVAGHVLPSFYEGTLTEEVAVSCQHEWSTGLFYVKTFVNEPTFPYLTMENGQAVKKEWDQKYIGVESTVNQLLFSDVGLAAGYTFFNIERDRVTPLLEGENHWYWLRLTKVMPNGLGASIGVNYYDMDFDALSQPDRDFWVAFSYIEYELPQKKGKLRFEIQNAFDRHFSGVPLSNIGGMKPDRNFMLMAEFNF